MGETRLLQLFFLPVLSSVWDVTSFSDAHQIEAYTGDDVSLSCARNMTTSAFSVKRVGHPQYVYHCIDGNPINPRDQEPHFEHRVELANRQTCSMFLSSPSIVLKNVTVNDTNEYEILCRDENGTSCNHTVSINITDRGNGEWSKVLLWLLGPVGAFAALAAFTGIGILAYMKRIRQGNSVMKRFLVGWRREQANVTIQHEKTLLGPDVKVPLVKHSASTTDHLSDLVSDEV